MKERQLDAGAFGFENRQPYFSIIIPIYKVENYLEKCLKSIQEQTFTNFECILVNQSAGKCEEICTKHVLENNSHFVYFFKTIQTSQKQE